MKSQGVIIDIKACSWMTSRKVEQQISKVVLKVFFPSPDSIDFLNAFHWMISFPYFGLRSKIRYRHCKIPSHNISLINISVFPGCMAVAIAEKLHLTFILKDWVIIVLIFFKILLSLSRMDFDHHKSLCTLWLKMWDDDKLTNCIWCWK